MALLASMALLPLSAMAAEGPPEGRARPDPVRSLILTRIRIIETLSERIRTTAKVRIEHVYCGSADLLGRTFETTIDEISHTGQSFSPPPRAGEVGIWALLEDGRGRLSIHWWVPYSLYLYPVREGITPRYEQAKDLAEAIQTIREADPGERPGRLRTLIASDVPEVAAWSVHALGMMEPEAIRALADGLGAGPEIEIVAQVALDEVLCMNEGRPWMISERRARLLKGWVAHDMEEYDQIWVVHRLGKIAQRLADPGRELSRDLLRSLLADRQLSPDLRRTVQGHIEASLRKPRSEIPVPPGGLIPPG